MNFACELFIFFEMKLRNNIKGCRFVYFEQQSQPVENSGSSTSSSGSGGGNYGTLGRGSGGSGGGVGMASMMDEMAKTLARRRAAVEKKQPEAAPVEI